MHGGWDLTQMVAVYYDKDQQEVRIIFNMDVVKQVTLKVTDK